LQISSAEFGGRGRPYLSLASREQDSAAVLSLTGDADVKVAVQQDQPDAAPSKGAGDAELDSSAQFLRR